MEVVVLKYVDDGINLRIFSRIWDLGLKGSPSIELIMMEIMNQKIVDGQPQNNKLTIEGQNHYA